MQNKPNFQKSQMNVNLYNTMDYENLSNWTLGENKPNSNPIKPNLNPKQSQGIKKVRSIFRRFIFASLTQAPHINITAILFDPNTRFPYKMNKINLKNPKFLS